MGSGRAYCFGWHRRLGRVCIAQKNSESPDRSHRPPLGLCDKTLGWRCGGRDCGLGPEATFHPPSSDSARHHSSRILWSGLLYTNPCVWLTRGTHRHWKNSSSYKTGEIKLSPNEMQTLKP